MKLTLGAVVAAAISLATVTVAAAQPYWGYGYRHYYGHSCTDDEGYGRYRDCSGGSGF